MADEDELLTPEQVAEMLGVKMDTLRRWRWAGRGPLAFRIHGRTIRYRRGDLDEWLRRDVRGEHKAKPKKKAS